MAATNRKPVSKRTHAEKARFGWWSIQAGRRAGKSQSIGRIAVDEIRGFDWQAIIDQHFKATPIECSFELTED